MSEHRLEDVLPLTDRLIVLNEGIVIADDTPQRVGEALSKLNHPMFLSMPSPMQIYAGVENGLAWPVTVKEGRQWLDAFLKDKTPALMTESQPSMKEDGPVVIKFKDVWFKYDKHGPDIIKDLSFEVKQGQFYSIVGGNGTGKTSTLSLMSGILQPYRGRF